MPFETPLMVTALVGLPDHVAGVFHLTQPPPRPDRTDALPRAQALVDAAFDPVFEQW